MSQVVRVTIRSHALIVTRTNWDIGVLKIGISDDALRARYSAGLRIWCEFGLSEMRNSSESETIYHS
jgi:hypothetical protein